MLEEFTQSIRHALRERVTSPLLGAFAVSWSLWNYRFLVVLFSDVPYEDRFFYLSNVIYGGDYWGRIVCQFIGPTITTLLYVYIYPIIAKYIYAYWRTKQNELRVIRQKADGEVLLSVAESHDILRRMTSLEEQYGEELARKDKQINELKALVMAEQQRNPSRQKLSRSDPTNPAVFMRGDRELSHLERRILQECGEFERNSQQLTVGSLKVLINDQNHEYDPVAIIDAVDDLVETGYLRRVGEDDGDEIIAFTGKGRKIFLQETENGL